MNLDLSNDYLSFDNLETVTLTPQGSGATAVTGVKALRRVLSLTQIAFLGAGLGIDRNALAFNLFTATLGTAIPVNGDTITDSAGVAYTIDSVDKMSLGSRYKAIVHPKVVNQP